MIHFDLNNGVATVEGYDNDMLSENPHELYVNGEDEEISVERGKDAPDLSVEKYGIPSVESNAEFNKPDVSHVSSKFTPFNKNHLEYGVMEHKFKGEINIGRWNGNNLEALVDTMRRRITVDDTIAPVVVAPTDVQAGYNADMGLERMGIATITDASPYPLESWYEDMVESNDGNYEVIKRTHFGRDVRGNIGSAVQTITLDLNVGVIDLSTTKSFDLDQNYPNPVTSSTTIPYASMGGNLDFRLVDMSGKTQKFIEKDNTLMGEHILQLDMNGMKPGQYILVGNDVKGSFDKIMITKTDVR